MTDMLKRIGFGALLCGLVGATAHADVTGSYDGGLTPKRSTETVAVALALTQTDRAVTGTLALPADLEAFGGAYLLTGKATRRRVKASGTGPGGVRVKLRAKIVGDAPEGKLKLKGTGVKLRGTVAFAHNVSTSDGTGCDGVYAANQALFDDQVLGQAMTSCTASHAPGLQAGATRLHVDPSDPLATARQVAALVDFATPASSRIIEKPLNILPNGGGMPILPGSNADQLLAQWVDLVAAAACL